MSQIDFSSQQKQKANKGFRLTRSARIDFTPMVDLGFLLITFFVFTAQLNKPTAMKLFMPKDDSTQATPVKCSASLTLLILKNGSIGWYDCKDGQASTINYTYLQRDKGLRAILLDKQREVKSNFKDAHELVVIIKPFEGSNYKNLVDVLDEMTINDITRYAIVEPEANDVRSILEE